MRLPDLMRAVAARFRAVLADELDPSSPDELPPAVVAMLDQQSAGVDAELRSIADGVRELGA